MTDIVVGVFAILAGALFCFRGYLAMRIVIPIWGFFAGFAFGAGLVTAITGDGFLSTAASWVVGGITAVVFALLAYAFYEVSVVLGMGAIGFVLGSSVMVALDVDWTWLVVLVCVVVALALALVALLGNLPMWILTVLTATSGASAIVSGIMLLAGAIETADLDEPDVVTRVDDAPLWWVLYAVLAVLGIVAQVRALVDLAEKDLRSQWAADGGRELRAGA